MNGDLLDTNVLSELRKGDRAQVNVQRWFQGAKSNCLYLSVLVIGEIRRGITAVRDRDPTQARALDAWLLRLVGTYTERILPVDQAVAERWGELDAAGRLPTVDGLLAATADVYRLTLITRNTKDVARTGVRCLNPFDPALLLFPTTKRRRETVFLSPRPGCYVSGRKLLGGR